MDGRQARRIPDPLPADPAPATSFRTAGRERVGADAPAAPAAPRRRLRLPRGWWRPGHPARQELMRKGAGRSGGRRPFAWPEEVDACALGSCCRQFSAGWVAAQGQIAQRLTDGRGNEAWRPLWLLLRSAAAPAARKYDPVRVIARRTGTRPQGGGQ